MMKRGHHVEPQYLPPQNENIILAWWACGKNGFVKKDLLIIYCMLNFIIRAQEVACFPHPLWLGSTAEDGEKQSKRGEGPNRTRKYNHRQLIPLHQTSFSASGK